VKIRPEGVELFHENRSTDGQTDGHYEANSRFSQFLWTLLKWKLIGITFKDPARTH